MTKILESICAALRSMNYIAAINKIRNRIVKIYKLPTYWIKTNTEFNKASSSESKGDQSCLLNVIVVVQFVELWQFES